MKRQSLYRSTLGKKAVVAVTGVIMVGFLILHVVGNLKAFLPGPEAGVADIDAYAEFLRSVGSPFLPHGVGLWIVRVTLVVALVLHVTLVLQLAARSRRARPIAYARERHVSVTRPARWMMVTGLALLAFIVFHILHFTTGTIDPGSFEAGAVYGNLYRAFTSWPLVALYVVGTGMVTLHLYHGAWSMFQTLGLDNPDRNRTLRALTAVLSVGLFVGFVAVPLAIALGALGPPEVGAGTAVGGAAGLGANGGG